MNSFLRTAVLALAFFVAVFLMLREKPHDDLLHLWDVSFDEIQSIHVEGEGDDYTLAFEGEQWWAQQGDDRIELDPVRLLKMLEPLVHLHAKTALGEEIVDRNSYGLDPVVGRITFHLQGDQVHALEIGRATSIGDSIYVQVSGKDTIFTLSYYDLKFLLDGALEWLKVSDSSSQ